MFLGKASSSCNFPTVSKEALSQRNLRNDGYADWKRLWDIFVICVGLQQPIRRNQTTFAFTPDPNGSVVWSLLLVNVSQRASEFLSNKASAPRGT